MALKVHFMKSNCSQIQLIRVPNLNEQPLQVSILTFLLGYYLGKRYT